MWRKTDDLKSSRYFSTSGQGLNKSHPYIYPILNAIQKDNEDEFMVQFKNIVKHSLGLYGSSFTSMFSSDELAKQTVNFACLANFVALKGGAIKKEQGLSADMATIMSNLYLAHCVQIYESYMKVSEPLTKMTIEKLTNENKELFQRVIYNLPGGFLLLHLNLLSWVSSGISFFLDSGDIFLTKLYMPLELIKLFYLLTESRLNDL